MLKAFKYRIYPDSEQEELLAQHFGAVRLIYNLALEVKEYAYASHGISLSKYDLKKQLVDLKDEFEWLRDVNSQSQQESILHLDAAYTRFFKELKDGTIKKKKDKYIKERKKKGLPINMYKLNNIGKPKYKSKRDENQSFACPQNVIIEKNKLWLPKFKTGISILLHREYKGEIKTVTISKTATGKYFASVLCENNLPIPEKKPVLEKTSKAFDLGLSSFIICSDGKKTDNPRYLRNALVHLKWMQKQLSRCQKDSSRYKMWSHRVAKQHEKIANQRKDFLHKLSDTITKESDTSCFESLNVSGMLKNHCLALSISDAGWGMFLNFIKYKSEWRGKNVLQLPTFEASSKECSECGKHTELKLEDRAWVCRGCWTLHDRDINAACVILKKCLQFFRDAGRSSEDAEVSPLPARERKGKRAVEASKVLDDMVSLAS